MEVLEARQVAAGEDHVHALGVLDVEVAHGVPAIVDDPEGERLVAAAAQLRVLDDEAEPVAGTGEAAPLAPRAVTGHRLVVATAGAGRRLAGPRLRAGRRPYERAGGEHEREGGAEHGEPD